MREHDSTTGEVSRRVESLVDLGIRKAELLDARRATDADIAECEAEAARLVDELSALVTPRFKGAR